MIFCIYFATTHNYSKEITREKRERTKREKEKRERREKHGKEFAWRTSIVKNLLGGHQ